MVDGRDKTHIKIIKTIEMIGIKILINGVIQC